MSTKFNFSACKFVRFATGQQLWPLKLKTSTKSPFLLLDFGKLMFIRAESVFRLILFQVKVSGENLFLLGANNSPSLKEPKKAVVHTHQKTLFLSKDQLHLAISWPRILRSGSVITKRTFENSELYRERFSAPFIINFATLLLQLLPFIFCKLCAS